MELDPLRNVFNRMFGRWEDSPNDQQYYVKIFFAMISALVCGLAGPTFAGIRGLLFGILVYMLSLFVIRYLLGVEPEKLGGMQKMITNSLPSYLLLWVVLWTIMWGFWLPPPT
ncbi:hypothetical protein EU546_01675 [Candidatus Thorarchaeota archaeon]|jgi:uncharacterized BrkB/YihY/UPF0761 family membrane protein|nr:MAG: hypothetical protein EU546_01675 [Candidatus Thorarchaeota archaeon]